MLFELNEMAILNGNVSKGLPNNVGDCVTVARYRDAGSYQYDVKLPSGDIAFVRESELNKLTKEQEELVTYIFKGNTVVFTHTNEDVKVLKVDFLNEMVEVQFDDGNTGIYEIEKVKEKESNSVGNNYKFKIGDTVKVIVEDDIFTGKEGEIVDTFKIYNDKNGYDVSFGIKDETFCFSEDELDFHVKENKTNSPKLGKFGEIGLHIGEFTDSKNKQYGSSVDATYEMMKVLMERYKNDDNTYTIPESLLQHILLQVRMMDKMNRIFNNPSGKGDSESPYNDLAGYSLIGIDMVNIK